MDYAILGVVIAFSLGVSVIDLRTRMINPVLNYSFFALAIAIALYKSVFGLNYAFFVIAAFAFAYVLYKIGAWAGGDAKFFTSLMAYLPLLVPKHGFEHIIYAFLFSGILLAPITLVFFSRQVIALRKQVLQDSGLNWRKLASSALTSAALVYAYTIYPNYVLLLIAVIVLAVYKIPLLLSIPLFLICAYFNPTLVIPCAIILLAVSALTRVLVSAFNLVRKQVLRKKLSVNQLREGDIPSQTLVEKDGKVLAWSPPSLSQIYGAAIINPVLALSLLSPPKGIVLADSSKARGLSENELRELKKRKQVTILWVKQSLPFAPVLAAGFIALALAANLA